MGWFRRPEPGWQLLRKVQKTTKSSKTKAVFFNEFKLSTVFNDLTNTETFTIKIATSSNKRVAIFIFERSF